MRTTLYCLDTALGLALGHSRIKAGVLEEQGRPVESLLADERALALFERPEGRGDVAMSSAANYSPGHLYLLAHYVRR